MKNIISFIILILFIILAFYLGLWVMLIGGIVQIANSINPVDTLEIAMGIFRIIFSNFVGKIVAKIGAYIYWLISE